MSFYSKVIFKMIYLFYNLYTFMIICIPSWVIIHYLPPDYTKLCTTCSNKESVAAKDSSNLILAYPTEFILSDPSLLLLHNVRDT